MLTPVTRLFRVRTTIRIQGTHQVNITIALPYCALWTGCKGGRSRCVGTSVDGRRYVDVFVRPRMEQRGSKAWVGTSNDGMRLTVYRRTVCYCFESGQGALSVGQVVLGLPPILPWWGGGSRERAAYTQRI
jgi:hypothetical protein